MKDKVLDNMKKRPVVSAGVNLAAGILLGQVLPPETTQAITSLLLSLFA